MNTADKKKIKMTTMGCWWPSKIYPDIKPAWDKIADELFYLADGEMAQKNHEGAKELLRLSILAKQESHHVSTH